MAAGRSADKSSGGEKKAAPRKRAAKAPGAEPAAKRPAVAPAAPAAAAGPAAARRPAGPTARTCPLVLDGEVDASDFSPADCLTCSEFDCRFCEAEEGSGTLRSRLFAGGDDGDEGEDGWGGDTDFDGGEDGGGSDVGEDEDTF